MDQLANMTVRKISPDREWFAAEKEQLFYIYRDAEHPTLLTTPSGKPVCTMYGQIADRLVDDLDKYGEGCYSASSLLPWQLTLLDSFLPKSQEEVVVILEQSFFQKYDWSYDGCDWNPGLTRLFSTQQKVREKKIHLWLTGCTHMQLTAACCIGNAYHSLNLSYVLAQYMEKYTGKKLLEKFWELAIYVGENSIFGESSDDIYQDFQTFALYYGIHLAGKQSK